MLKSSEDTNLDSFESEINDPILLSSQLAVHIYNLREEQVTQENIVEIVSIIFQLAPLDRKSIISDLESINSANRALDLSQLSDLEILIFLQKPDSNQRLKMTILENVLDKIQPNLIKYIAKEGVVDVINILKNYKFE